MKLEARPKVEMQNACNFAYGNLLSIDFFLNRHSREGGNLIPNEMEYDYNCHNLQDQSIMLFTRIWNKSVSTPEEQRLVSGYLMSYGFLEVEFAFREAVKHNNRKLVYVEGICKKRKEKLAIESSKEEARQKKLEQLKLIPNQQEAWKNLHLCESIYGKKPSSPG